MSVDDAASFILNNCFGERYVGVGSVGHSNGKSDAHFTFFLITIHF